MILRRGGFARFFTVNANSSRRQSPRSSRHKTDESAVRRRGGSLEVLAPAFTAFYIVLALRTL